MSDMKQLEISNDCILCGLCEDKKFDSIFSLQDDGSLNVCNSGLVDMDTVPALERLIKACPTGALLLKDIETLQGTPKEVYIQLNQFIYEKLRDYPFNLPDSDAYEYQMGVYQVPRISANYRSAAKYRTYDRAEDAGISEFRITVWSQAKAIGRQYIAQHKIKKLKQFYTYGTGEESYYETVNNEIAQLLYQAKQMADVITNNQSGLPRDFTKFDVAPDWGYDNMYKDLLKNYETRQYDFEHHLEPADEYRCYVNIGEGSNDLYYYDYDEAESTLRKDMDDIVDTILMKGDLKYYIHEIVGAYHTVAQKALKEKVNLLQTMLKEFAPRDTRNIFSEQLDLVYKEIMSYSLPTIQPPQTDFDTYVDSGYRFSSDNSAYNAACNRRERCYKEGKYFVDALPKRINELYLAEMAKTLTEWKRLTLKVYDIAGKPYPKKSLYIPIENGTVEVYLGDYENINPYRDTSGEQYILSEIFEYGRSVGDVAYAYQSDCTIRTDVTYDIVDTFFGGTRERNHRYRYWLDSLYDFRSTAYNVSVACVDAYKKSAFLKGNFENLKNGFVKELQAATKNM